MSLRLLSYIVFFVLIFPFTKGWAQIKMNPAAEVLQENGAAPAEPQKLEPGTTYQASAPFEVRFSANVESPPATLRYEWNFANDAEFNSIFLTRFDEITTYTFEQSGMHYIRLQVTDTETGVTDVSGESFVVQITESELKIPNAFSPNGDGINDIFKVQYKSLVSFNAVVFNRWGQKLYQWGLLNIDKGWDGTSHGRQVPAGVYFIVIEAKGADGVVYNHKGDINILR